jgi:hypothetical protein
VIGSGYIEHPPQRPFADRVLVQPPTIKPEEIPDWYDSQGVLHHGPRPGGQQGYTQRGGYSTVSNSSIFSTTGQDQNHLCCTDFLYSFV